MTIILEGFAFPKREILLKIENLSDTMVEHTLKCWALRVPASTRKVWMKEITIKLAKISNFKPKRGSIKEADYYNAIYDGYHWETRLTRMIVDLSGEYPDQASDLANLEVGKIQARLADLFKKVAKELHASSSTSTPLHHSEWEKKIGSDLVFSYKGIKQ